jgi:hypothetical protein
MRRFLNLTQGLAWAGLVEPPYSLVRIESTRLEAKDWGGVLGRLGADFLHAVATGPVVVYDASARKPQSRAIWQGIPWIRYACERAWRLEITPAIVRGGHNASSYFDRCWKSLPKSIRRIVGYYARFNSSGVRLRGECMTLEKECDQYGYWIEDLVG